MKYPYGKSMQVLLITLVIGMAISLVEANAAEARGQNTELPAVD